MRFYAIADEDNFDGSKVIIMHENYYSNKDFIEYYNRAVQIVEDLGYVDGDIDAKLIAEIMIKEFDFEEVSPKFTIVEISGGSHRYIDPDDVDNDEYFYEYDGTEVFDDDDTDDDDEDEDDEDEDDFDDDVEDSVIEEPTDVKTIFDKIERKVLKKRDIVVEDEFEKLEEKILDTQAEILHDQERRHR